MSKPFNEPDICNRIVEEDFYSIKMSKSGSASEQLFIMFHLFCIKIIKNLWLTIWSFTSKQTKLTN